MGALIVAGFPKTSVRFVVARAIFFAKAVHLDGSPKPLYMKKQHFSELSPPMIAVIVIGIILFFIGIIWITSYWNKESDMYLMPYGYKGQVTIFYNQTDGVPEKLDGERRIFEIPTTGVLYTQSSYKRKWDTYYYVQPDGKLQQLMYGSPFSGHAMTAYSASDIPWVSDVHIEKIGSGNHSAYKQTYYIVGQTEHP